MHRFFPLFAFLFFAGSLALVLLLPRDATVTKTMQGTSFPVITLEPLAPPSESAMVVRPRIVNFFASWCTPCIAELPHLRALADATGAQLVGIAWNDPLDKLTPWLEKYNNPFDVVYLDPKGSFGITMALRGVPETYLVAADGRILTHHSGVITPAHLPELEATLNGAR